MGIGIGAARFFRALKKDTVSAPTHLRSYVGEEGRVLLPIRPGQKGKIVIETLAGRVEMMATTQDKESIGVDDTVIVASVREGIADVSALSTESGRRRAANAKRLAATRARREKR